MHLEEIMNLLTIHPSFMSVILQCYL